MPILTPKPVKYRVNGGPCLDGYVDLAACGTAQGAIYADAGLTSPVTGAVISVDCPAEVVITGPVTIVGGAPGTGPGSSPGTVVPVPILRCDDTTGTANVTMAVQAVPHPTAVQRVMICGALPDNPQQQYVRTTQVMCDPVTDGRVVLLTIFDTEAGPGTAPIVEAYNADGTPYTGAVGALVVCPDGDNGPAGLDPASIQALCDCLKAGPLNTEVSALAPEVVVSITEALQAALDATPVELDPATIAALSAAICACFATTLASVDVTVKTDPADPLAITLPPAALADIQAQVLGALTEAVVDVRLARADVAAITGAICDCFQSALDTVVVDVNVTGPVALDPATVTALVDGVRDALDTVVVDVNVTGPVALDPATVTALADAVRAVLDAIVLDVNLDPSAVTAIADGVQAALEAVTINLDAAAVQAITDGIASALADVVIDTKMDPADISALATAVCECVAQALDDVVIDVKLDPADIAALAEATGTAVGAAVTAALEAVVVDVRLDPADIEALATAVGEVVGVEVNQALEAVVVDVKLDPADIAAQAAANGASTLAALEAATVDVRLSPADMAELAQQIASLEPRIVMGEPTCVTTATGSVYAVPYSWLNADKTFSAGGFLDAKTMLPITATAAASPCDCQCIDCP
jgi:hypothetical protein